jgi:hypothetical protein
LQDDSDSNNREDVLPASPLDQPGPSGLVLGQGTSALDKATTGNVQSLFFLFYERVISTSHCLDRLRESAIFNCVQGRSTNCLDHSSAYMRSL